MAGEPNVITKTLAQKSDICNENKPHEPMLNIFGHPFTISTMQDIASFAELLQKFANQIEERKKLPDGSIFILKTSGKEVHISFGGIAKK